MSFFAGTIDTSGNFGDSSKMKILIFNSGSTFHMMPEVLDFIPGQVEDKDKYIDVLTDITLRQNKMSKNK